MRFLLDESADGRLYHVLRDMGHDVESIARDVRQGVDDDSVLAIARASGRILITADRDFGRLVVDERASHSGVLYFRLRSRNFAFLLERLNHVLFAHANQLDEFLVVTDYDVRLARGKDREKWG